VRLFAAVEVPDGVRDWLDHALSPLRERAPTALRWTDPASWHVTLAFYGEVPPTALDPLEQRLRRAVARRPVPLLGLGGLGSFGSPRASRVLWVGIDGDVATLRSVAASAQAAGRRVGVGPPAADASRPFRPHLTLARARPAADVQALLAAGLSPSADGWRWRAEQAVLVRSDLGAGPGGTARHTVLARLPFSPAGGP
jgi:2'-5' RNA ligase